MNLFSSGESPKGKPSAEERLLEVIQKGEAFPQKKKGLDRLTGKIRTLLASRSSGARKPGFSLAGVNKALGGAIVLGLAFSVINTFFLTPDIGQIQGRMAFARANPSPAPDPAPLSVEEVLAPLAERDIFQPKTVEAEVVAVAPPPKTTESGLMENLRLVGIAWGTEPEAMIRESDDGRTFFLKAGEELKGVVVKEIQKDRVIVEFEGQTKEIM